jgi:hypothetical protein
MARRRTKQASRVASKRASARTHRTLPKDDSASLREAEKAIRKALLGNRRVKVTREGDSVMVRVRAKANGHAGRGGETVLERLRAAGLVGVMRSGIGDLSTNPKHMEGFGQ